MEEIVKKDILDVLKRVQEALNKPHIDISTLKALSDRTIHNASIYQDEHSVSIAILIYSLSKVMDRVKERMDFAKIKNLIGLAVEYLEDNNLESYDDFVKKAFGIISSTDSKFKIYIQEVIRQASIKKGSKIYEHGISASKTSSILGISLWELYQYLGATDIAGEDTKISSVRDRLKFTRGLF
jgi:hypothetical protein